MLTEQVWKEATPSRLGLLCQPRYPDTSQSSVQEATPSRLGLLCQSGYYQPGRHGACIWVEPRSLRLADFRDVGKRDSSTVPPPCTVASACGTLTESADRD